jgi:hypothetical protein
LSSGVLPRFSWPLLVPSFFALRFLDCLSLNVSFLSFIRYTTPVGCDTTATVAASTSRLFHAPERTTRGILNPSHAFLARHTTSRINIRPQRLLSYQRHALQPLASVRVFSRPEKAVTSTLAFTSMSPARRETFRLLGTRERERRGRARACARAAARVSSDHAGTTARHHRPRTGSARKEEDQINKEKKEGGQRSASPQSSSSPRTGCEGACP